MQPRPGWVGGSWVTISAAGRLWPWDPFFCFAPGSSSPLLPTDLAPTKTGNIPREKKRTDPGLSQFGGVAYHTGNRDTRGDKIRPRKLSFTERMSWAFLKGEKGRVYFCSYFFNKKKRNKERSMSQIVLSVSPSPFSQSELNSPYLP